MRRILRKHNGERTPLGAFVEPVVDFLRAEATGGLLLLIAAVIALIWANSPISGSYEALWSTKLTIGTGDLAVSQDLQHWVNSGLMTIFFLVVGMEIKRELVTGELRDPRTAVLPAIAAAGGVLLPVAIFLAVTSGGPDSNGWGIPTATDIAFAVGVVALLGDRVSSGAKLFLLSLAIVDDVIAIIIIAIFYTEGLSMPWLLLGVAGVLTMPVLRRFGVRAIWPYVLVGAAAWYATLQSGTHATLVGVAAGLITPARPFRDRPVLDQLEHRLHPFSAFLVVPIFALANAGVDLRGDSLATAVSGTVAWGAGLGLLLGKTFGIVAATLITLRLHIGVLPSGMDRRQLWGVSAVAGIGFTVSLFVADLAYSEQSFIDQAKIGILAGSLASGLVGVALLFHNARRNRQLAPPQA